MAYYEMIGRISVSYDAVCTKYTSINDTKNIFHGKVFLMRPKPDTTDGFYFWISQSDTTYFFSDMLHTYGTNKKRNVSTIYDAYYFMTHWMVGSSMIGELVWSSFATPIKIKEKIDTSVKLESKADTVFDGIDCYRVLVKYPDNIETSEHELTMYFNKIDYAPFYLVSKIKHGNIFYFADVYFKNYTFGNVDYSRFSAEQIPKNYKVSIHNPALDK